MARVLFGSIIEGIRGTIGGVTFSGNGSGAYAKSWQRPVNKRSAGQLGRRIVFSGPGERWRALTAGERSDWNDWAAAAGQEKTDAFGNPYFASGWNWFVALTCNCHTVGTVPPDTVPSLARPIIPTITGAEVSYSPNAEISLTFTAGEFDGLYVVAAFCPVPYSVALLPKLKNLRFFGDGPLGAADDEVSLPGLDAMFGSVQVGQVGSLLVYAQNSEGYRSEPLALRVEVS